MRRVMTNSVILDLLEGPEVTKICAPMVRYSKHSFRMLVRKYRTDIAYTPMIIADSFVKSQRARDAEFSSSCEDRPLVVQFASNNADEFATASEIVKARADGVDLNCGCPQRWAMAEHYGAYLLSKPDIVSDMVSTTRRRLSSDFTISIKIRIEDDIRKSVEYCRQIEAAGVSFITVHGRTKLQRGEKPNYEAIRTIKESLTIPVVANGDINSLSEAEDVAKMTGVNGVMAAQGMLNNPALYAGYESTPLSCVEDWLGISTMYGTQFSHFQHHMAFMVKKLLPRPDRHLLNLMSSSTAMIDFLEENYAIVAKC